MKYNHTSHLFMSGQTINAIIRKYNGMVVDADDLIKLQHEFNRINDSAIPKIGQTLLIPVMLNE